MDEELKMEDSDNQKFCLKWNNFQSNFMSQFEALKEDEDFVDVTLSCYGESIKAHKVVLSACSPYLKNIFKEHPCKHPVIILDCLSFSNLEALIQFIYTGQVYVEQGELSSFLKAAETLQIRGLSESSTTKNFVETKPLSSDESDSQKTSAKRDADSDDEVKKCQINKKVRRSSCGPARENNEAKSKDWSSSTEKSEESCENSSLNGICEVSQVFEKEETSLTVSSGEEDYSTGELKRPHWLDPRSCPLCNRVYSNLSNLRQHMKLIHNPTLVTCRLCYKTFKTDLYLRRHLNSYHELGGNGSGSGLGPNHPGGGNWTVKTEPEAFRDAFNPDMYPAPEYSDVSVNQEHSFQNRVR